MKSPRITKWLHIDPYGSLGRYKVFGSVITFKCISETLILVFTKFPNYHRKLMNCRSELITLINTEHYACKLSNIGTVPLFLHRLLALPPPPPLTPCRADRRTVMHMQIMFILIQFQPSTPTHILLKTKLE